MDKWNVTQTFKTIALKGAKSKKEVVAKILLDAEQMKIRVNAIGTKLDEKVVLRQVNQVIRDMKKQTGGWRAKFDVSETETEFKIFERPVTAEAVKK